ncbi:hypothetical protein [Actinopolymorpha alba]|uniref:hypothetical protein n=1 Tax=Actinopolymorpha alba TaxID=533267 RepID=UPI0003726D25|nr:hypothetical protein [Actinopolymorpha alba]
MVGTGVALLATLTASPGVAATDNDGIVDGSWTSRASAHSLNLRAGGQIADSGAYVAVNDGVLESVTGANAPKLPLIGDQQVAVAGALGQDALATSNGYAAACAGVVGSTGTVQLGVDNTCLASDGGGVQVSLGTLDQLGLSTLLDGDLSLLSDLGLPALPLPDVSVDGLPNVELRVVGDSLTAECQATPGELEGRANLAQAKVVAVVDDQQVALANLSPAGVNLNLGDVLGAVRSQLSVNASGTLDRVLAAVPTSKLDAVPLASLTVGGKSTSAGQISVTALGVETAYPGLLDLQLGKVNCASATTVKFPKGPQSAGIKAGAPDVKTSAPQGQAAAPNTGVKGGTNAEAQAPNTGADNAADNAEAVTTTDRAAKGADSAKGDTVASGSVQPAANSTPLAPWGWAALGMAMLVGLGLAGFKVRQLRRN